MEDLSAKPHSTESDKLPLDAKLHNTESDKLSLDACNTESDKGSLAYLLRYIDKLYKENVATIPPITPQFAQFRDCSLMVFLYYVHYCRVPVLQATDEDWRETESEIDRFGTFIENELAYKRTFYIADKPLVQLSSIPINLDRQTFGLTVVVMYFAHFQTRDQYALYVPLVQRIPELQVIERTLYEYRDTSIKLPYNLSTTLKYSLLEQKFTGTWHIDLQTYNHILSFMRTVQNNNDGIAEREFIDMIKHLHPNIVTMFYTLTSLTKDCKAIYECRTAIDGTLNYKFEKIVTTSPTTQLLYWFQLPARSTWFAYSHGLSKVSSFTNISSLAMLNVVPHRLIFGYINNGAVYVLRIDEPISPTRNQSLAKKAIRPLNHSASTTAGETTDSDNVWHRTVTLARQYGLKCPWMSADVPIGGWGKPGSKQSLSRIHFVEAHANQLYRLPPKFKASC